MQGEATRITLLITQTLETLGIPYAVGGWQINSTWLSRSKTITKSEPLG